MKRLGIAEEIREKLLDYGYIGVAECECIGNGNMRYTLEKKYEEQSPPCFHGDFIFLTSDRFLEILNGYLSNNGDEIIPLSKEGLLPISLVNRGENIHNKEIEL